MNEAVFDMKTPHETEAYLAPGQEIWRKIGTARATQQLASVELTPADMKSVADAEGNTVAHLVAASGLDKLMQHLFNDEVRSVKNHAGQTPRTYQRAGPNRIAYLSSAAKSGDYSDIDLNEAYLMRTVDKRGNTIAHMAARWGKLHDIPGVPLTEAILSAKNTHGQTPSQLAEIAPDWVPAKRIEQAMYHSEVNAIPDLSSVTIGQLMVPIGRDKKTLAHLLAERGALGKLPVELLSYDMLILRGGWRYFAVYELAYQSRCHKCVPPGLRKQLNEEFGIDQ